MFLDERPRFQSNHQLQVYRATANRPIQGLLIGEPTRVMLHWWKGKSLPCVANDRRDCCLCDKEVPVRYYAFYPILGKSGSIALVEVTATAEAELMDGLRMRSGSGVPVIKVFRAAGKKNNPLHVEVQFKTASESELESYSKNNPNPVQMKRSLCRLWNLPEWSDAEHVDSYFDRVGRWLKEVVNGNL